MYVVCVSVCVWDVIHCYGSMLLNVSPCWGEECPERAVNAPRGWTSMLIHTSVPLDMFLCCLRLCVEFKQVCIYKCGCVRGHKSLTRLWWHVSLFVTMVIVSGLSRDVHPDDEIRLHQWTERAETNRGEQGNDYREGMQEVGDGLIDLLMECTKRIIKHTHTAVSRYMYTQTDRPQNLIILKASISLNHHHWHKCTQTHSNTQWHQVHASFVVQRQSVSEEGQTDLITWE